MSNLFSLMIHCVGVYIKYATLAVHLVLNILGEGMTQSESGMWFAQIAELAQGLPDILWWVACDCQT